MVTLKFAGFSLLMAIAYASPVPSKGVAKRQSAVPFGTVITSCTVAGTAAVTFDDGPFMYTSELLDMLAANQFPATFFLNGQNVGNINDYTDVVQRMVREGHQVGSHTFSHSDLTTLDEAGIVSQMKQLETAITSILGNYPAYMRPPYAAVNDNVMKVMEDLGYHVVNFNIETLDWQNESPDLIQNSVNNFQTGLDNGGNLSLSHDTHPDTVQTLAPAMIAAVKAKGLTPVTVGQCLGDPPANWYRTS